MSWPSALLLSELLHEVLDETASLEDLPEHRRERRERERLPAPRHRAGLVVDPHVVALLDGVDRRGALDRDETCVDRVAEEDPRVRPGHHCLDADADQARGGLLPGAPAAEVAARDHDRARLQLLLHLGTERLEGVRTELYRVDAHEVAPGDDDVGVDAVAEDNAASAEAVRGGSAHGVVSSTNHSVGITWPRSCSSASCRIFAPTAANWMPMPVLLAKIVISSSLDRAGFGSTRICPSS